MPDPVECGDVAEVVATANDEGTSEDGVEAQPQTRTAVTRHATTGRPFQYFMIGNGGMQGDKDNGTGSQKGQN